MPFNPNVTAARAVSYANDVEDEAIDGVPADKFSYARVVNASGTDLFTEGEVFAILATAAAGRRWTQGIAADRNTGATSVPMRFDQDSILLAGLLTSSGKPDLHFWDARRFEIVEASDLTEEELEQALERF